MAHLLEATTMTSADASDARTIGCQMHPPADPWFAAIRWWRRPVQAYTKGEVAR